MPSLLALPRGLRLGLALSLALNLFLLAFLGAQAWHAREDTPPVAAGEAASTRAVLAAITRDLPPDDAQLLRGAFIDHIGELARLRRQAVQAMDRVRADIARQSYDGEATRADMAAARGARQRLGPVIEQALLEVLPRMSGPGRQALARLRLLPQQ
jgi:uncharacterized membrane protein